MYSNMTFFSGNADSSDKTKFKSPTKITAHSNIKAKVLGKFKWTHHSNVLLKATAHSNEPITARESFKRTNHSSGLKVTAHSTIWAKVL